AKAKIIVKALLAAGADPNERVSTYGWPVIVGALPDLADMLIERGAKFDVTTDDGNNALHYAAMNGPQDSVRYWLDRGLGLESKNKKGETPLHYAAGSYLQNAETLTLLVEKGAELKARDNDGLTPLHHAGKGFNLAAVSMLL